MASSYRNEKSEILEEKKKGLMDGLFLLPKVGLGTEMSLYSNLNLNLAAMLT